jgi:hypothetical protein
VRTLAVVVLVLHHDHDDRDRGDQGDDAEDHRTRSPFTDAAVADFGADCEMPSPGRLTYSGHQILPLEDLLERHPGATGCRSPRCEAGVAESIRVYRLSNHADARCDPGPDGLDSPSSRPAAPAGRSHRAVAIATTSVIRADTLRSLDGRANEYHRTHVTPYVYTHPEEFRLFGMTLLPDRSHLRLTLD